MVTRASSQQLVRRKRRANLMARAIAGMPIGLERRTTLDGHRLFRAPFDDDRLAWLDTVRASIDYSVEGAATMVPPWVNHAVRVAYALRDHSGKPIIGSSTDWISKLGNVILPALRDRDDVRHAMETAVQISTAAAAAYLAVAFESELAGFQ